MGCEWKLLPPNYDAVNKYLETHYAQLAKVIQDAQIVQFPNEKDDPQNSRVREMVKTYGKGFVDLDFPPSETSLYRPETLQQKGDNSAPLPTTTSPIQWRRASEFMDGPFDIFADGIDPGDIRQGALGNCWFLCAIAALTEFPELVLNLFPEHSKTSNEAGVYTVRFCKSGIWRTVRVDDYFPCFPHAGPIYSRSHGNELWVLLLEKAYSKLHGSYEAIKSGWAYEAMMDLTGAPYKSFRLDDPDVKKQIDNGELWALLLHFDKQNFIMSASTPGEDVYTETGKRPGKNGTGLVAGHAYTLISVRSTSRGDRILKLRNPWGSMEWTGDWSDSSPLWTDEMQVRYSKR